VQDQRPRKKEAQEQSDSEEEYETQPLECKKRTLSVFPQLPDKAMLKGEDVNKILSVAFSIEPVEKNLRTGVSPSKILNPQPISSVVPTLAQRSEKPPSSIFRTTLSLTPFHPPSSPNTPHHHNPSHQPQKPPVPPQTIDLEPMQLNPPEKAE
jgi:hypothetical protein